MFTISELKLGLSEDLVIGKTSEVGYGTAVRLDQAQFHPSIDLSDFEHKRAMTIHPSEGEVSIRTIIFFLLPMSFALGKIRKIVII